MWSCIMTVLLFTHSVFCSDCNAAPDSSQCPLDPADRGKGRMGEFGTDEESETAKVHAFYHIERFRFMKIQFHAWFQK